MVDNKFLIGKTKGENEFNVLLFACCDQNEIIIPSIIKEIDSYCFTNINGTQKIKFENESKLETISKFAFFKSSIHEIKIPSTVQIIDAYSFFECSNLEKVEFSIDSKLKFIGKNAFESTSIQNIKIPLLTTNIEEYAFHNCQNIKIRQYKQSKSLHFHQVQFQVLVFHQAL